MAWVLLLVFVTCVGADATTFGRSRSLCPVCQNRTNYYCVTSFGGYVYQWPSKFQLVFWPATTRFAVSTCTKCGLSLLIGDSPDFSANMAQVRQVLGGVKHKWQTEDYTQIPMSDRLDMAEKVYSVLNKDDDFWCEFYRIKGYHLARENRPAEAALARRKALTLAQRMLGDPQRQGQAKQLLLISGAMRHFLGDDDGATSDIRSALQAPSFHRNGRSPEENAALDDYYNQLAKEYLKRIAAHSVPNDDGPSYSTDMPDSEDLDGFAATWYLSTVAGMLWLAIVILYGSWPLHRFAHRVDGRLRSAADLPPFRRALNCYLSSNMALIAVALGFNFLLIWRFRHRQLTYSAAAAHGLVFIAFVALGYLAMQWPRRILRSMAVDSTDAQVQSTCERWRSQARQLRWWVT